jgi:hypothetical protein
VRSVIATEVEAGGWETQGGTGAGIGTGKTTSFAGYALSEVYWSSVKAFGTGQVQRAKVLANAAFHEFAHNKCAAVKTDFENFVHSNGGYGILGANPLRATLNSLEPNNENNKFVRLCIDKPMPQYIWYL